MAKYNIGNQLFGGKPAKPDVQHYYDENGQLIDEYGQQIDALEGDIPQEHQEMRPVDLAKLQRSAMDGVTTDPALRQAQMRALQRMQEVGDKGYTAEEEAALSRIRRDNAQADRGRREAAVAGMQARGVSGGGAELAAQLASAQAAQESDSQASLDIAAQAQRRALATMQESGSMAGHMRNQEFGEKSDVAKARDRINEFNTTNSVRAQFANNAGKNNFNQQRFENKTRMQDMRGDAMQMKYNSNADAANRQIQDWQDKDNRRRARVGAITGLAGAAAGAYFGGPAGAQAGQQAGSAMGNAFFAEGGSVKGPEIVEGDHIANDVVPAQLSAGEVVLPKSIARDPHKAAAFVKLTNEKDILDALLADLRNS